MGIYLKIVGNGQLELGSWQLALKVMAMEHKVMHDHRE
jgi:hypothetical protein